MSKITRFFENWTKALKIFPVAHLILCFLTLYGFYLVNIRGGEERKTMIAGFLGLLISIIGPLLLLHVEGNEKKIRFFSLGSQIFSIFAMGGYDWILRTMGNNPTYAEVLTHFGVLILLILGILVSIARIFKKKEAKSWFSRTSLLESLAFGVLAGLVVWGGLSAAIGSINALFDVNIHWKWFQYFGVFSMILLAGSFVLNYYTFVVAGLPKGDKSDFELVSNRVMKIFGTYIFLPLALVYLAIFLAYGAKILITGVRPKGIIVWLGTGYFVGGMLIYYFTFPQKTNFFAIIHKILFGSFIFIALMMSGAIGLRVSQYGISTNRYFIMMLIFFIILFSILALSLPKARLRLFVSLLFGLSLISLYGPLSARNIAFSAQKTNLESMLIAQNINLPLQKDALALLTGENAERIATTLTDFVRTFPCAQWNKALFDNQYSCDTKNSPWSYGYYIREYLGAQAYYGEGKETKDDGSIDFGISSFGNYKEQEQGLDIAGYEKFYTSRALDAKISGDILFYSLSGETKKLNLSPYLELIYAQAHKGEGKYSDERRRPFIIEGEEIKIIITDITGRKEINGKFILDKYIGGFFFTK